MRWMAANIIVENGKEQTRQCSIECSGKMIFKYVSHLKATALLDKGKNEAYNSAWAITFIAFTVYFKIANFATVVNFCGKVFCNFFGKFCV